MDNGASSYRRYLDGDDSALTPLVGEYKDGLILYINGYVHNIHTAEELAEDTFFRLITKKPRFNGKSSFRSWLYAIGRNVAVDHIRHSSRLKDIPLEEMGEFAQDAYDLEKEYMTEENRIMLHKALQRLKPDYRNVLWLMYFENFTGSETACAMNKNERQIKNLLYRAKAALRSELEKDGFVYEDL